MDIQEEIKTCKACHIEKPISNFGLINPKKYRRSVCNSCMFKKQQSNVERYSIKKKYQSKWGIENRKKPDKRASCLKKDITASDRKKNRVGENLPIAWIDEELAKPCSYCKQSLSKSDMTLDRIDNTLGHIQTNLLPACKQCNYFRRDMPYDAWVIIAENLPRIAEMKLLNGWVAGGRQMLPKIKE